MLSKIILALAAVAGAAVTPVKRDVQCSSGGSEVTYAALGNAISDFCADIPANNFGNYHEDVDGISFVLQYGGKGCGQGASLPHINCDGLYNPLLANCGPTDGMTHGGKIVKGCWTATVYVN